MISKKSRVNLLRYVKELLKENRVKIFMAFIAMLFAALINLYKPYLTQQILDSGISEKNIDLIIKLSIVYILSCVIVINIEMVLSYFYSKTKRKVSVRLKNKLLNHVSKLSGSYFIDQKTGNVIRVLDNDMFILEDFGLDLFFNVIFQGLTGILAIIFLIKIQLSLAFIVIILQFAMTYLQIKFTEIIAEKINKVREIAGDSSNQLVEYVSNIMNIVISKSKRMFFKSYIDNERKFTNETIGLDIIISGSTNCSILFESLIVILTYLIGGIKAIKGELSIGELIAFTQYTTMLSNFNW